MNNKKDNNFWKHYKAWKDKTLFMSTGIFDNEDFKALCDPEKIDAKDMIKGALEILSEKDDFIVSALDKYFENLFGEPMFTYTGYVPLPECCRNWKIVLNMINSENCEKFNEKFLYEWFEISEE